MFPVGSHTRICISAIIIIVTVSACATYYQRTIKFQEYIMEGKLQKAKEWMEKNDRDKKGKNRVLYLMYRGWLNWMLGKHEESITDLEEADLMIEDYRKKAGLELASLVTNPSVRPYRPEDFESVMVNYYKALNFLVTNRWEEAVVENRKMIIKLQQLNDKYKEKKNRYSDDAFAHLIIGLIYDARNDFNNAFIAYRNSLEAYENIYSGHFNLEAPLQLKKDLLRTAYLTGFYEELDFYENKFGMEYIPEQQSGGELVFIWHNGLGPVKAEWSINFTRVKGEAGFVTFVNEEYGLSFPYYIGDKPESEKNALRDLNIVRIAFPKYVERSKYYTSAELEVNGGTYPLEISEDINQIAFKTLHDRMIREIGNSLLRVATKKAVELAARKATAHDDRGEERWEDLIPAAITITNALTEKADTRNWQTLPHSIYYRRVKLPEGENEVVLKAYSHKGTDIQKFDFNIKQGTTQFFSFRSLESGPRIPVQ